MSSLSFAGNETSYLTIPNSPDINFGTGDFTIEWYQYQTDGNPWPRIFEIGNFDENISIGVSIELSNDGIIETGSFYFWSNGPNMITSLNSQDYKNKWVHFAIARLSGTTTVYMNGTSIGSITDNNDYNSSANLVISNESIITSPTAFGGYLAYFHWIKGVAKYTSDFTVLNTFPPVTDNTVLLLSTNGFSGTLGSTVENSNVGTYPLSPFTTITPPPVQISMNRIFQSLYSDNSLVYYKPHSLASCGVGSVRNSRYKSKHT